MRWLVSFIHYLVFICVYTRVDIKCTKDSTSPPLPHTRSISISLTPCCYVFVSILYYLYQSHRDVLTCLSQSPFIRHSSVIHPSFIRAHED